MKKLLGLSLLIVTTSFADVTLSVDFGDVFSSDGTAAPLASYAVLVADTGSDGFIGSYTDASNANFSAFNGTSLTVGSLLSGSGNDQIIGVFNMTDYGGVSGITGTISGIDVLTGSLSANQQLGLYWFPTVTSTSISGSLTEYGFFRSDVVQPSSNIAFLMPSDGANVNLFAFTTSAGGTLPDNSFTAVAVPEPSTYAALLGALALGFVVYRRKRS